MQLLRPGRIFNRNSCIEDSPLSLTHSLFSLSGLSPSILQVIVLGSGHILPYDQPERGLNLIQTFINMTG